MRIGISITKKVLYRGVQQEFSNVYHYDLPTAVTAPWQALIDEIVATERSFHSTDVTFVSAKAWTAGGSVVSNEMQHQAVLTGTGNQAANTSMDRERAVLIQWPAGKDVRGHPVTLKKWFHSCGGAAGVTFGATELSNTSAISDTSRGVIASKANELIQIGATEFWQLCSKSGRLPSGSPTCHKYLEHHELGDAWR